MLKKDLRRYHEQGLKDGLAGKPQDPFVVSRSSPAVRHPNHEFLRWAYDAGWFEGHNIVMNRKAWNK